MHDCSFEMSEVFVDGKLDSEKLLSAFDFDLSNATIADESWPSVIEKAIATCKDLGKEIFKGLKLLRFYFLEKFHRQFSNKLLA